MENIQHCPLCGHICSIDKQHDKNEFYRVICTNPEMDIHLKSHSYFKCAITGPARPTKEQAIAAWNSRATEWNGRTLGVVASN